jgi:glycosyltransferase involved in cell wall biosynthesis
MPTKVAMFVFNNTLTDARVHREAETLASAGYDVRIYAFLTPGSSERQTWTFGDSRYVVLRLDQRSRLARVWDAWWPRRRRDKPAPEAELRLQLPPSREPQVPCAPPLARVLPATSPPERRRHHAYIQRINQCWWRAASRWKPDVCHAHDLNALWAAQATAMRCGAALVYDSHEIWDQQAYMAEQEQVDYWQWWEARLAPSVDAWVTVNRSLSEFIGQRYECEPLPLHNCPRLSTPAPASKGLLKQRFEGRPVALFSGGFVPGRGIEQMIAAAILQKEVAIVIQGFGDLLGPLQRLADEHRSPVTFLGAVPRGGVVDVCAGADIGVQPTLPDCLNSYYCTPNKVFDYMMAGLAIAAGDIPEMRSLLTECGNGRLYDAWSPDDLAAKLLALANPEVYRPMGEASRRAAETCWNWEQESLKLLDLYRRLLQKRESRALRAKNWVDPQSPVPPRTVGAT